MKSLHYLFILSLFGAALLVVNSAYISPEAIQRRMESQLQADEDENYLRNTKYHPLLVQKLKRSYEQFNFRDFHNYLMKDVLFLNHEQNSDDGPTLVKNELVPDTLYNLANIFTGGSPHHKPTTQMSQSFEESVTETLSSVATPNNKRSLMESMDSNEVAFDRACSNVGIRASYKTIGYYCNNTRVSKEQYDNLSRDPAQNCTTKPVTDRACFCPLDKTGQVCQYQRDFSCVFDMVYPERKCEIPDMKPIGGLMLDGDFPCVRVSMKNMLNLKINMTCKFNEPRNDDLFNTQIPKDGLFDIISSSDPKDKNQTYAEMYSRFTYVVQSDATLDPYFVLSAFVDQPVVLRPFNFYSFSDDSEDVKLKADKPGNYLGIAPLEYNLNISSYKEEFFAGDRLYMEVGFIENVNSLVMQNISRIFIDFTDRHPPEYKDNTPLILAITIPSAAVLAMIILVIGIALYVRYRKNKSDQ